MHLARAQAKRLDECIAKPDVNQIWLLKHDLEREVAGIIRRRRKEHGRAQLANRETQRAQQTAERPIEFEAPPTPASLDNFRNRPVKICLDATSGVYVEILKRNGRQMRALQRFESYDIDGWWFAQPNAGEI